MMPPLDLDLWKTFFGAYESGVPFFWVLLGVGLALGVYVRTESPASTFVFLLVYGVLMGALLGSGFTMLVFMASALFAYLLYRVVKG
jgi:FtsH-binding integral membrane protein